MPDIVLSNVQKSYGAGSPNAVSDLDLHIRDGEFMCLLGPSGCGKTTTLRMIAGLENLTDGEIGVGEKIVDSPARGAFIGPEKRGMGLVFQSYALWPHLTIERNTDFGLRLRKVPKAEREARVTEVMKALDIEKYRHRYPSQLSGGQQQRVALARMLAVNPGVPARSVPELIALARGGRKFTFGSSGNGASSHLAGALFNRMAGTDFEHVPYRGTGPALNDLLAGHIAMVFTDVMTALPHVQEGRLRALGVTTAERSAALPEVPTVAEQGLAGYDASVFFGIVVPAATPAEARERLRAALAAALAQPETRQALNAQGMQIAPDITPDALATLMASEAERWSAVIRETGARAD